MKKFQPVEYINSFNERIYFTGWEIRKYALTRHLVHFFCIISSHFVGSHYKIRHRISFNPEQFCDSAHLDVAANAATESEEEPIRDEVDHECELDAAYLASFSLEESIAPVDEQEICTVSEDLKANINCEVCNYQD